MRREKARECIGQAGQQGPIFMAREMQRQASHAPAADDDVAQKKHLQYGGPHADGPGQSDGLHVPGRTLQVGVHGITHLLQGVPPRQRGIVEAGGDGPAPG